MLALPGDEMIPRVAGSLTHAITVHCPPSELWPWLIQMGAGRAGWYSYDVVDNGGRESAEHIVPELQNPKVGTVFPAMPGGGDGFVLIESDRPRSMVLAWPGPEGRYIVTWAFMLAAIDDYRTRLVVRARASESYRFRGLPRVIGLWLVRIVHFIMERKQLIEIARRAEAAQLDGVMRPRRRMRPAAVEEVDSLLDRFMPEYDLAERHGIQVAAPATVTFSALSDMDLNDSRIIRAIFKARELLLGADREPKPRARGLVAVTRELGWGVLAEVPGQEIVMGAVTQPWKANVEFRSVAPGRFASFAEPGYVKIAWTLRADQVSGRQSIARTETRVLAIGPEARGRFRAYWRRVSPGVILIRKIALRLVRKEAERRVLP